MIAMLITVVTFNWHGSILGKEDNTTKARLNRYLARFSKRHVGKGRTKVSRVHRWRDYIDGTPNMGSKTFDTERSEVENFDNTYP